MTNFPNNMRSANKKQQSSENGSEGNSSNGLCNNCKLATQLRCQRCGDYYCSTECQEIDWSSHRYICFPMPSLVLSEHYRQNVGIIKDSEPIADKMAQLHTFNRMNSQAKEENTVVPIINEKSVLIANKHVGLLQFELPPTNDSLVIISAVVKPNIVYVRSVKDSVTYLKNIEKVSMLGETAKPLTKKPNTDDIVITTFEGEGIFYRAQVIQNVDENKMLVAFVDFGNTDVKTMSDLREMPKELYSLKVHPVRIKLKNIKKDLDNKDVHNYLQKFEIDGTTLRMINITTDCNNEIECELINAETNENVNNRVTEILRHEKLNNNVLNAVDRVMIPPFEKEFLPIGEDVDIFILDNSQLNIGMFSCCLNGKQYFVEENFKKLQNIADFDKTPYKPKPGEYCIVKYGDGNQWFRAQAIDYITETEVLLTLIDFGEEPLVDISFIRRYPNHDEINFPCYTNSCLIEDLPDIGPNCSEFDSALTLRLKEIINIKSCQVLKVNFVKDDVVSVTINHLTKSLRSENII